MSDSKSAGKKVRLVKKRSSISSPRVRISIVRARERRLREPLSLAR